LFGLYWSFGSVNVDIELLVLILIIWNDVCVTPFEMLSKVIGGCKRCGTFITKPLSPMCIIFVVKPVMSA
jgi:hypothetical protein